MVILATGRIAFMRSSTVDSTAHFEVHSSDAITKLV
jgi:hypothetical protein